MHRSAKSIDLTCQPRQSAQADILINLSKQLAIGQLSALSRDHTKSQFNQLLNI